MNQHADRDEAWARLQDGSTGAEHLLAIARRYPEFAAAVGRHPNATRELVAWANGAPPNAVDRGAVAPQPTGPHAQDHPQLDRGPHTDGGTLGVGLAKATPATSPDRAPVRDVAASGRRTLPPRSPVWAVVVICSVVLAVLDGLTTSMLPGIGANAPALAVAYGILFVVTRVVGVLFLAFVMFAGVITATTPTRRAIALAIVPFGVVVSLVLVFAAGARSGWIASDGALAVAVWLVSTGAPRRAWWGLLVPAVGTPLLQFALLLGSQVAGFVLLGAVESLCVIVGFLVALSLWLRSTVSLRTYLFHGTEYERRRRQIDGVEPTWANATAPSASAPTNTLAVLALVFGIVCASVGAVLGLLALARIPTTGERGRGLALAGLAIACLWFGTIATVIASYHVIIFQGLMGVPD